MKIINGNELFVQKCDVEVALKDKKRMPSDIRTELEKRLADADEKEEGQKSFLLFDNQNIANYFKGLDYVLDYDLMKTLSWTEVVELCERTIIELNKTREEGKKALNEEEHNVKMALLKYKLETIKNVVQSKKSNITIGSSEKIKEKKKLFNIGKKRK